MSEEEYFLELERRRESCRRIKAIKPNGKPLTDAMLNEMLAKFDSRDEAEAAKKLAKINAPPSLTITPDGVE